MNLMGDNFFDIKNTFPCCSATSTVQYQNFLTFVRFQNHSSFTAAVVLKFCEYSNGNMDLHVHVQTDVYTRVYK